MAGVIIVVLLLSIMNLFWPSDKFDKKDISVESKVVNTTNVSDDAPTDTHVLPDGLNKPSSDEKVKLMTAAYETLESGRKNLKRRLSRLKHELWDLKFEPEKAKMISDTLLEAHKLIKNPEMLGAFAGVQEIEDEIAKIQFADKSLNQIDKLIEENKSAQESRLN